MDVSLTGPAARRRILSVMHSVFAVPLLYPPTIDIGFRPIPLAWLLGISGLLFATFVAGSRLRIERDLFIGQITISALIVMVLFGGYAAGGLSVDIFAQLILGSGILFFSIYVLGPLVYRGQDPVGRVFAIFVGATTIHSLLVILVFLAPEVRLAFHPVIYLDSETIERLGSGFRSAGLSATAGEAMSVGKGIAMYLLVRSYLTRRVDMFRLLVFGTIILGAMILLNRTGLVIGVVGVVVALLSGKVLKVRPMVILTGVAAIVLLAVVMVSHIPRSELPTAVNRTLEPLDALVQTGKLASRSTDALLGTMLIFPDDNWIQGDGNYGRQDELGFVQSDIGYIRMLFGGGLICVAAWIVLVSSLALAYARGAEVRYFAKFLAIVWLLANVKILWVLPLEAPTIALGLLLYMKHQELKFTSGNPVG